MPGPQVGSGGLDGPGAGSGQVATHRVAALSCAVRLAALVAEYLHDVVAADEAQGVAGLVDDDQAAGIDLLHE